MTCKADTSGERIPGRQPRKRPEEPFVHCEKKLKQDHPFKHYFLGDLETRKWSCSPGLKQVRAGRGAPVPQTPPAPLPSVGRGHPHPPPWKSRSLGSPVCNAFGFHFEGEWLVCVPVTPVDSQLLGDAAWTLFLFVLWSLAHAGCPGMWAETAQRGDASPESKQGGTYGRSVSQSVGCLKCFLEKQRKIWLSRGKTETREKQRISQGC